jgi:hypothetical protein
MGGGNRIIISPFLLPCIIERGPLLYARIVTLPLDFGVWREGEDAFHRLSVQISYVTRKHSHWEDKPDLQNPSSIISCPDTQNVLAIPNTQHGTADFFTGLGKLVTNNRKQ